MENVVFEKSIPLPPINIKEVYRYSGVGNATDEIIKLTEECITLVNGKLLNKVCYGIYDIKRDSKTLDFGFAEIVSDTLLKNLDGCGRVVIFCATVGLELDRLISRYGMTSPSKAVILQGIGAERIEALCDAFNDEIKREFDTVPRLSPGYGDFPLEFQRDIFNLLSPSKRIGLTLNDSLLMSPTKSVTALIGIRGGI